MLYKLKLDDVNFEGNAEKIEVDGIYYVLNNTDNTASVAEHPGGFYSGEMTIPQSIVVDNVSYKVVSISSFAFKRQMLHRLLSLIQS